MLAALALAGLAGCTPRDADRDVARGALASPEPSPAASPPMIAGQPYRTARILLIAGGWRPVPREQIELDAMTDGNAPALIKAGYTEVLDCETEGDAKCNFGFADPTGRHLVVTSQGKANGDDISAITVAMLEMEEQF